MGTHVSHFNGAKASHPVAKILVTRQIRANGLEHANPPGTERRIPLAEAYRSKMWEFVNCTYFLPVKVRNVKILFWL